MYSTSTPHHLRPQSWLFLLQGEERPVGAGSHGRGAGDVVAPPKLFSRNAGEHFSAAKRQSLQGFISDCFVKRKFDTIFDYLVDHAKRE